MARDSRILSIAAARDLAIRVLAIVGRHLARTVVLLPLAALVAVGFEAGAGLRADADALV